MLALCSTLFLSGYSFVYPESDNGRLVGDACSLAGDSKTAHNGICSLAKSCSQMTKNAINICSFQGDQPIVCCQVKFKAEESNVSLNNRI